MQKRGALAVLVLFFSYILLEHEACIFFMSFFFLLIWSFGVAEKKNTYIGIGGMFCFRDILIKPAYIIVGLVMAIN